MSDATVHPAHERWEDLMIEVLDGRAAGERRAELERHLAICAECRAAYDEYREIFGFLTEAGEDDLAREFWDSLAADIGRRIAQDAGARPGGGERAAASSWNGVTGGLVAAGVAILVLIGLYLELPRGSSEPHAFTTSYRARLATAAGEDPALVALEEAAVRDLEGRALVDSEGLALTDLDDPVLEDAAGSALAGASRDPLADLANAEEVLLDLTPQEAEQLLDALESQT